MATYSLSGKAVSDLEGIYEYTILNFGLKQAQAYLLGLHRRFQILADNVGVGRNASQLAPELRRHEYQSHVVFLHPEGERCPGCTCAACAHGCQTPLRGGARAPDMKNLQDILNSLPAKRRAKIEARTEALCQALIEGEESNGHGISPFLSPPPSPDPRLEESC